MVRPPSVNRTATSTGPGDERGGLVTVSCVELVGTTSTAEPSNQTKTLRFSGKRPCTITVVPPAMPPRFGEIEVIVHWPSLSGGGAGEVLGGEVTGAAGGCDGAVVGVAARVVGGSGEVVTVL
jgi:hypothetical protein